MKSIGKLTLLAVILCCGAWVAAQSSPSGGSTAPSGSSGTAGQSSSSGSSGTAGQSSSSGNTGTQSGTTQTSPGSTSPSGTSPNATTPGSTSPNGRPSPPRRDPPPPARHRRIRPLQVLLRQTALRIRLAQARHRPTAPRTPRLRDLLRRTGHRTRRPLDRLRRKPRLRVAHNLQPRPTAAHPHHLRLTTPALLIEELRVVQTKAGQLGPPFFLPPRRTFLASQPCQEIPHASIHATGSSGALSNPRPGSNRSSRESRCPSARA